MAVGEERHKQTRPARIPTDAPTGASINLEVLLSAEEDFAVGDDLLVD